MLSLEAEVEAELCVGLVDTAEAPSSSGRSFDGEDIGKARFPRGSGALLTLASRMIFESPFSCGVGKGNTSSMTNVSGDAVALMLALLVVVQVSRPV